jgi:cytochrome c oxidase subunit IV
MEHKEPNYMAIFGWLAILTVAEITVTFVPIARALIAILLIGLAITKATMVAMYFMHLKFERRTLGLIAVTPMVLCILLVFALAPDLTAVNHSTAHRAAIEQAE